MPSPFQRVAVVGCGLIGGSFALASRRLEGVERVVVTDRDPGVRNAARTREAADEVVIGIDRAVRDADLVLLAVPVAAIPEVARSVIESVRQDVVITDVGSVKNQAVREIESFLGEHGKSGPSIHFLGGHPMCGSEEAGLAGADPALFQGATWVLTPTPTSDAEVFNALAAHIRALGARVLAIDPATHDRIVAVASHLPQILASTLADEAGSAARASGDGVLAVTAGGFRDLTRIAASDPDLWAGILAHNRAAVAEALESFRHRLADFHRAVREGDWSTVRHRLAEGRAARRRLPTGERATELVDVVVPIPDRPGMLAEVTTVLGTAGINIEDVGIRPAGEDARGALVLAVAGRSTAARARDVLAERGFDGHLEAR